MDRIITIDGQELIGTYDDSWRGRDYGIGQERKVRLIVGNVAYILHGTTMSDRMRVVRREVI